LELRDHDAHTYNHPLFLSPPSPRPARSVSNIVISGPFSGATAVDKVSGSESKAPSNDIKVGSSARPIVNAGY
jgi:hypothetical protein